MATRRQQSSKIFYGWWIVLVAGIALSVHFAPIRSWAVSHRDAAADGTVA
jgi:hypothetical protein